MCLGTSSKEHIRDNARKKANRFLNSDRKKSLFHKSRDLQEFQSAFCTKSSQANSDTKNINGPTITSAENVPNLSAKLSILETSNRNGEDSTVDDVILSEIQTFLKDRSIGTLKGKATDNKIAATAHKEVFFNEF